MISLRMSSRYFAKGMPSFSTRLAEILGRQLVVLRDARDRALDLRVVDADAGFLRVLHQHALGDQALEQLLLEDVGRGGRHVLRLHLREHERFCSSMSYCVSASSLTIATTRSMSTLRSDDAPARTGAGAADGAAAGVTRCAETSADDEASATAAIHATTTGRTV